MSYYEVCITGQNQLEGPFRRFVRANLDWDGCAPHPDSISGQLLDLTEERIWRINRSKQLKVEVTGKRYVFEDDSPAKEGLFVIRKDWL